MMSVKIIAYTS